jgi:hypothetical protein
MEEFNKKFNDLITSLHKDIKPPDASILIYYIEVFNGEMRNQLRDKEPGNLKFSQEMAIKIDKNMQASGKSNLHGFSWGNTSKQKESKDKAVATESNNSSSDPLKELTEAIKAMEANHAAQLNAMQIRLISMEISQAQRLQQRHNKEWKRRGPTQDQRPHNHLETMNMFNEEAPPFCITYEDFHEESTCPIFCQIDEKGFPETNNFVRYSRRSDFINNVGKTHTITNDQWNKTTELCQKVNNVTKLYGETPTLEHILEMARYKGVTYQTKGNDNSNKTYQNILKAITPPNFDLSVDLGSWILNAKVLVPVTYHIKLPSHIDRL